MTPEQNALIKAAILADPLLANQSEDGDGLGVIRDALNAPSDPPVLVWRTDARVIDILDAIDFSKYTPSDAADNTVTYSNRLLAIQTKQINLQTMLQGRDTINANKANVRSGLRDAVIAIPAGPGGASVAAGGASGVTVLAACTRNSRRIEAILAGADAQTGSTTAKLMGYEGTIASNEVDAARRS